MAGPPLLSALWFPVHQRTTSTAISISITGLGVASSYLLGNFGLYTLRPICDVSVPSIEWFNCR